MGLLTCFILPSLYWSRCDYEKKQKNKKPNNNEWTTLKCLGISWETRNSGNLCPHSHMVPLCCSCHSSIPMPHHSPVPGNAVNHATCDEIFVFVFFFKFLGFCHHDPKGSDLPTKCKSIVFKYRTAEFQITQNPIEAIILKCHDNIFGMCQYNN